MGLTHYIWDELSDCVLQETDGTSTATVEYTSEPNEFGGVLSQWADGTTHTYHYDTLGSMRQLTDGAGTVKDTYSYDAWGNEIIATGMTPTPYRFCGRYGYQTDELGDIYVRARTYLPSIARWTSIDPIFHDGMYAYSYADASPAMIVDPSGEKPCINTKSHGGVVDKGCGRSDWVASYWPRPKNAFVIQRVSAHYEIHDCNNMFIVGSAKCGTWQTKNAATHSKLVFYELWVVINGTVYTGVKPKLKKAKTPTRISDLFASEPASRKICGHVSIQGEMQLFANQKDPPGGWKHWKVDSKSPGDPLAISCTMPPGWEDHETLNPKRHPDVVARGISTQFNCCKCCACQFEELGTDTWVLNEC